jgi:hypothetical protein
MTYNPCDKKYEPCENSENKEAEFYKNNDLTGDSGEKIKMLFDLSLVAMVVSISFLKLPLTPERTKRRSIITPLEAVNRAKSVLESRTDAFTFLTEKTPDLEPSRILTYDIMYGSYWVAYDPFKKTILDELKSTIVAHDRDDNTKMEDAINIRVRNVLTHWMSISAGFLLEFRLNLYAILNAPKYELDCGEIKIHCKKYSQRNGVCHYFNIHCIDIKSTEPATYNIERPFNNSLSIERIYLHMLIEGFCHYPKDEELCTNIHTIEDRCIAIFNEYNDEGCPKKWHPSLTT